MRFKKSLIFAFSTIALAAFSAAAGEERSLFEDQNENAIEPVNLDKIARVWPEIMEYGYAGKVLLEFDIDQNGKPVNAKVLEATRRVIFDKAAFKLLGKFQFEKGKPMHGVRYEMGFCLQSDSVTPVLCDIQFERVAGPVEPLVVVYSIPYFTYYHVKKGICGTLVVRFDVDSDGHVQNPDILEASRPGQFEIGLKRALDRFKFEKNKPAKGIEYRVTYRLPGRC